ncbi:hypothetical protein ABFW14_19035 [Mycolicibacterium fortuitum]|uniref:hypothetical protein n=1 Tax=Mycolicibacterium fortuitum TaxID=1766 RepID=UPI0034CE64AB
MTNVEQPTTVSVPKDYDLLAPVPTPPGVTAGNWTGDEKGRLIRVLSDGRIQRGNGDIQCKHCTVPVDSGDICAFCADYTVPETVPQQLAVLGNKVQLVRHDGNEVLQGLPADAPLMAVVDLVTALGHLKRAAVALDRANDTLEAASAEVTR